MELNNIISDYNAFDFESEYNEMQSLWNMNLYIEYEQILPDIENPAYYYDGVFNEERYNSDLKSYYEWLEIYQNSEKIRAECNAGYQKYERKGELDKAIINIPFPKNLDTKKDIYIVVTTDSGIDGVARTYFKISAVSKLKSIDVTPSNKEEINEVKVKFLDNDSYDNGHFIIYMSPENEKLAYTEVGSFEESEKNSYPFYVYSYNKKDHTFNTNTKRFFYLCSYDFDTYTTEKKVLPLKKLPSDASLVEIESAGKSTGNHIISVNVNKDIFNQFDRVFLVKYWFDKDANDRKGEWKRNNATEVSLSDDNKISFEEETIEFYDEKNLKERVEYRFEIMGVKDAVEYWTESPFIIDKDDKRIEDNVAPFVNVQIDYDIIDSSTFELDIYPINIFCDYSGSFLTVESFPSDVGGHLDENTKVSIDIFRVISEEKKLLEESIELTNCPIDKYLNIPISDLKNGRYELEFSISDTKENSSTFGDIFFNVDRKTVSMNEIEMHGSSFKIKNDDATSYTLNYFDTSKNSWGTPQKVELEIGESSDIGKNGMFQLRFGKDAPHPADNNVSYPYLFHFPERKLNARDLLILRNSVRVFTDQPFFIHTIKSM